MENCVGEVVFRETYTTAVIVHILCALASAVKVNMEIMHCTYWAVIGSAPTADSKMLRGTNHFSISQFTALMWRTRRSLSMVSITIIPSSTRKRELLVILHKALRVASLL